MPIYIYEQRFSIYSLFGFAFMFMNLNHMFRSFICNNISNSNAFMFLLISVEYK